MSQLSRSVCVKGSGSRTLGGSEYSDCETVMKICMRIVIRAKKTAQAATSAHENGHHSKIVTAIKMRMHDQKTTTWVNWGILVWNFKATSEIICTLVGQVETISLPVKISLACQCHGVCSHQTYLWQDVLPIKHPGLWEKLHYQFRRKQINILLIST